MAGLPRIRFQALLALACGGLIAICALEWGLREFVTYADLPRVWPPGARAVFEPVPELMPGVRGSAHFAANSFGLRAREWNYAAPPEPALLCLGGSTTECLYLDTPKTWCGRLESELSKGRSAGAWVANAGRSGHTTREHVLQLEALLDQLPRIDGVLLLCGVNDLCKRLAQDTSYDPHALDTPAGLARVRRDAFAQLPLGQDPTLPFYKDTRLWGLLRSLKQSLTHAPTLQDSGGQAYVRWRAHRASARALRDELPDLGSALGEYRRNLARIADDCARRGVPLWLATQPALWRADLPPELAQLCWMGGIGEYQAEAGHEYYTLRALADGMQQYNEVMRALVAERRARGEAIALVELARALPADGSVFYDDVHFNEHGAERVAEEWLRALATDLQIEKR